MIRSINNFGRRRIVSKSSSYPRIALTCLAFVAIFVYCISLTRSILARQSTLTPTSVPIVSPVLLLGKSSKHLAAAASTLDKVVEDKFVPFVVGSRNHVQWVIILHVSNHHSRYRAARETWFTQTSENIALVSFGMRHPYLDPTIPFLESDRPLKAQRQKQFPDTQRILRLAARTFPHAKYFTKVDDDAYLYSKNLYRKLFESELKGDYFGYPLDNEGIRGYASGGAGYTLSRQGVEALLDCPSQVCASDYEDVCTGACIKAAKLNLTTLDGHHPQNAEKSLQMSKFGIFWDMLADVTFEGFLKPFTFHYLDWDSIMLLHDKSQVVGSPDRRSKKLNRLIHFLPGKGSECAGRKESGWKRKLWSSDATLSHKATTIFQGSRPRLQFILEVLFIEGGVFVVDMSSPLMCSLSFIDHIADDLETNAHLETFEGFYSSDGSMLGLFHFSPTGMALMHVAFRDANLANGSRADVVRWIEQNKLPLYRVKMG